MLPVEIVTESVAFLAYYDLGALKITSQLCSFIARRCVGPSDFFDFSEFTVIVNDTGFYWLRYIARTLVVRFVDDESAIAFISEAFRNCVFDVLEVNECGRRVLDAIKDIASTVVVAELSFNQVLSNENELLPSAIGEILEVADCFRQIQAKTLLCIKKLEIISKTHPNGRSLYLVGVEHSEVAAFCQRKGIQTSDEMKRPSMGFV